MPYDERTLCELSESAEITPIGIQLEVNAEILYASQPALHHARGQRHLPF